MLRSMFSQSGGLRGSALLAGAMLTLFACSSSSDNNDGSSNDADAGANADGGGTDGGGGDSGSAQRDSGNDSGVVTGCDVSKAFGTPVLVAGVNSTSDEIGGSLSPDELTIYFSSDRAAPGNEDLYVATRASRGDAFGAPTALSPLNTSGSEIAPSITADGLTIYFARSGANPDVSALFSATRGSVASSFSAANQLALPDTGTNVCPFITPDNTTLYFLAPEGIAPTIYQTSVSTDGGFGTLFAPVVNGGHDVLGCIVAAPNGLSAFYDANLGGAGNDDIYAATRSATNVAFGTGTDLSTLDDPEGASPSWLSPDGCTLYITSDRTGTTGGQDIWSATRPL
jgi:hypothetical protein